MPVSPGLGSDPPPAGNGTLVGRPEAAGTRERWKEGWLGLVSWASHVDTGVVAVGSHPHRQTLLKCAHTHLPAPDQA